MVLTHLRVGRGFPRAQIFSNLDGDSLDCGDPFEAKFRVRRETEPAPTTAAWYDAVARHGTLVIFFSFFWGWQT